MVWIDVKIVEQHIKFRVLHREVGVCRNFEIGFDLPRFYHYPSGQNKRSIFIAHNFLHLVTRIVELSLIGAISQYL